MRLVHLTVLDDVLCVAPGSLSSISLTVQVFLLVFGEAYAFSLPESTSGIEINGPSHMPVIGTGR
jgi:hypothetical protein